MSKFFGFLRRSFVVVVTCVITVISMAVAISPPVSAAGVFSPFNFYQLYQMLHGLLLGDGGGNSQTFGEWLEENMTRTVGSGNEKKEFLITPGMKLSDMMTEASLNLVLGAALSDGGIAGTSKIKDLIDSWNEVYDTSDIGEIGSFSGGGNGFLFSPDGSSVNIDYALLHGIGSQSSPVYGSDGSYGWIDSFSPDNYVSSDAFAASHKYIAYCSDGLYFLYTNVSNIRYDWTTARSHFWIHFSFSGLGTHSGFGFPGNKRFSNDFGYNLISDSKQVSCFLSVLSAMGVNLSMTDFSFSDYIKSIDYSNYVPSDNFIGPVYAMPAAKQLITDTGTLSGLRLDVQTEDGTPDISAALDHAGVDNVNDLVAGVAAGTIPMSQVYDDMRVVPYVLTDVDTGEIVTDLNVSATDAKTKAVALDKDLSIPKDFSAVDAYQITGKTWDPSLSKYKLPLFDFFPFCLPYDAYQFLTMLDVTPVAPVFQVDTTPLFSHTRFFHAADGYKITLDLTKYEEVFQILRAGECLAIVVGLCLISYKLIHGGD